jgi:hypothetical protein
MTGTFTIHHQPAVILFDSSATHSFISLKFGIKIGLDFHPTKGAYMIATPGGKIASNKICRNVPIQLDSNLVKTDLLLLDLDGMDILLGMDWMTSVAEPPELFRLKCASHHYTADTNSTHFKRNNPLVCRVSARCNHGSTGSKQVYLA